jgi:hypothetical protein
LEKLKKGKEKGSRKKEGRVGKDERKKKKKTKRKKKGN